MYFWIFQFAKLWCDDDVLLIIFLVKIYIMYRSAACCPLMCSFVTLKIAVNFFNLLFYCLLHWVACIAVLPNIFCWFCWEGKFNVCCNILTSAAIYLRLLQYIYFCCNIFTSAAIYLLLLRYIYVGWFCCEGNKCCNIIYICWFVMKESLTNAAKYYYLRLLILLWRKA